MKNLFHNPERGYRPYVLSALLRGLSYPSYPYARFEWLAWAWMVPMLLALRSAASFPRFIRNVFLTLMGAAVISMAWLLTSSVLGTVLLFFLYAFMLSLPLVAFYFIRQTFGWRLALWMLPFIWVACDWLYHQTEGSFGWFPIGVTQSNYIWLVQYADITGVWGVSFWLVLFNALIVMVITDWQAVQRLESDQRAAWRFLLRRLTIIATAMLLVPLAYATYAAIRTEHHLANCKSIAVLMVQPNINPWRKGDSREAVDILGKTLALTKSALSRQKPDLVIWPETAIPSFLPAEKVQSEFIAQRLADWQVPLLTGTFDAHFYATQDRPPLLAYEDRNTELFNAAVLLEPAPQQAGARAELKYGAIYHKQVLMPFVERVPLALSLIVTTGL